MAVRQGLTLDGRFVLVERLEAVAADTEHWRATDTRLDKPVTILAVSGDRAAAALAAGNQARLVRDGRLARIVRVFQSDDDRPTTYLAVERPQGTVLADLLERRLLPVSIARAIVAGASEALAAAEERGLTGGITSLDLTVTARGNVAVANAGLGEAVSGITTSAGASLALVFRDAIALGDDLPATIEPSEHRLIQDAAAGKEIALAAVLTALSRAPVGTLHGLRSAARAFPWRYEADQPALTTVTEVTTDEPSVVTQPAPETSAPHSTLTPASEPTTQDEDRWEFEELVDERATDLSGQTTVAEAFFALMHRQFPESARFTERLERAHARAAAGPRINATPWLMVGFFGFIITMGWMAYTWAATPFEPTFDLRNPPPQSYPEYTSGPTATPSSGGA